MGIFGHNGCGGPGTAKGHDSGRGNRDGAGGNGQSEMGMVCTCVLCKRSGALAHNLSN